MTPEQAINGFKAFLPPPPYKVDYSNDTGPDDGGFWEWWEVAGLRFETEAAANAFFAVLTSVP